MAPKPDVINQRRAIKIHPFSPLFNKVTLGYEQVLKMGINLEVKAAYINSNITKNTGLNNYYGVTTTTGAFLQGGVKFLLGQEYYLKGMKYMHPLKGRYIRIDAIVSDLGIKNIANYSYNNPGIYTTQTVNANAFGYGLFINYGRQWILGNILTLDYYVGLGASGSSVNYSNGSLVNIRYPFENITNYYGFERVFSYFSVTGGFTLGYILK